MGILRSDRVSGLGGANAINGSVFFGNGNQASGITSNNILITEKSSDFTFGTGDFTIEGWFYTPDLSNWNLLVGDNVYGSASGWGFYFSTNPFVNWWKGGSSVVAGGTPTVNTWHHVAFSRESGTNRVFLDGALGASASDSTDYTATQILIGANQLTTADVSQWGFKGYASNVRVIKGEAIYTAAFTVPTSRLEKTDNTVLLCCQSPGNILQEATGKTLYTLNTPVASTFAPDVGEDYGTTFADNTKFDTLSYMVPPGGTTAESNRGRAVMAGGMVYPTASSEDIDYMEIQSGGITKDFGDLTVARGGSPAPMSSSTRGVIAGGLDGPTRKNEIDFITIATTGNATDFGNLSELLGYLAGVSNQTRGLICGGNGPSSPTNTNQIEYITIASTGDSVDFSQLNKTGYGMAGSGSSTRGLIFGGYVAPGYATQIDTVVIASTGVNASDFGDTTIGTSACASCSSATRALFAGGYNSTPAPSTKYNTIEYVTIASTGTANDFGDLTVAGSYFSATSNGTRGIFGSRMDGAPYTGNVTIDSVIIASTGNAVNWGDHHRMDSGPHDGQPLKRRTSAIVSDSHGGIS